MSLPPLLADGRGRRLGGLLALGLARAVATVGGIFLLRHAVDRGLMGAGAAEIVPLAGGILLAAVATSTLKVVERSRAERLGSLYAAAVRARLLEHRLGQRPGSGAARLGKLLAQLAGELSAIRAWPGRGLPRLLSEGVLVLGCLGAALLVDPRIGLALLLLLAADALAAAALRPGLLAAWGRLRRRRGRAAALAAGTLARHLAGPVEPPGTPEVETASLLERLAGEEARIARLAADRAARAALLATLPDLVRGLVVALLVLLAAGLGGAPASAGTVAATLALLAALVPALRELARALDRHAAWSVARARLEAVLARPAERAGERRLAPAAQERQPTA